MRPGAGVDGASSGACGDCLRRSYLLGHLAPRIAGILQSGAERTAGLLALDEDDLIRAVARDRERSEAAREFAERFDPGDARQRLAEAGIETACDHCSAYPPGLRDLTDPPATLFYLGGEARLRAFCAEPGVAIVGSRNASPYGLEVADSLGRGLGACGVRVVSGLALGIDAGAHRGCLDADGPALAVVAGGVDVPYPRQNRPLYARLRERGVILSELPPGRRPLRWSFPARNRIMAALAELTLVVEASERSGSLITASFAGQMGRTVAAVPGRVTAGKAAGSNRLLREGAAVVRCAEDALDELFGIGNRPLARPPRASTAARKLEPDLRKVLDAVEDGEDLDGIARAAELPPAAVRTALARLELQGLVTRLGVGAYERALR